MTNKSFILAVCLMMAVGSVRGAVAGLDQSVQEVFGAPPSNATDNDYWDETDDFVPFDQNHNDNFDWNLFKVTAKTPGNALVSPISVKLLLTMLYEAARGNTLQELKNVLQITDTAQATRERVRGIINSLSTKSKDFDLEFGNRVYLHDQIVPRQRYAAIMEKFYQTKLVKIDFTKPAQCTEVINKWVSNITHGKIDNLVSQGDVDNAVLLLLNAIYFKGSWRSEFPANGTGPAPFYVTPTKQVNAPYMSRTGRYFYLNSKELDAKILRVPYKGRKFSMFVVMPNSKGGLSELLEDLTSTILRRHQWLMDEVEVKVTLPKFKFDYTAQMSESLKDLGIRDIFATTASLPGLARGFTSDNRLVVSNVLQKAGLEVNEQGSTAYAATEIVLTNKFGSGDLDFTANRPFIFFIEDETTGAVLFIGKVEDPLAGSPAPVQAEAKKLTPPKARG